MSTVPVSPCIRPAALADAPAVARVHVASWRAAYAGLMPEALLAALSVEKREARWREILAREGTEEHTFVVALGGEAVGFASTGLCRDEGASAAGAELYALYLGPEVWGRGLGRALFAAAVEDLRERGRTAVTLWVLDGNARARRFYEAMGMQRDGGAKVEVDYGAPLPHLRYWLPLSPAARR